MCKYNYSGIRCANIDVKDNFCIGEGNCSLCNIMGINDQKEPLEESVWYAIPKNVSELGMY
jgi:hypothetical protein